MKKHIFFITLILFVFLVKAQSPSFQWAKKIGGTGLDYGQSMVTDTSNNVYITGYFSGVIDADPSSSTFSLSSNGSDDIFIVKLDHLGNFIWAKSFGGINIDQATSITLDSFGNILLTGSFQNVVDFDAGSASFTLVSNGSSDIFLAKYDPNGNFLWSKSIGGINYDSGLSVKTDFLDNIVICGFYSDIVDFDPNSATVTLSSLGSLDDMFILQLDNLGNFNWAKSIGSSGNDYESANAIAIDNFGSIFITGYFSGITDFDPGSGIYNVNPNFSSSSARDIFVLKLDMSGNFNWVKTTNASTSINNYPKSISIDNKANLVVSGVFLGSLNLNMNGGTNSLNSSGNKDIFILKLDNAGNFIWVKKVGGVNDDLVFSSLIDNNDNIYYGGAFWLSVDFDPNVTSYNLTSVSSTAQDAFISKLDSSGNFVWAKKMGGASVDQVRSITIDRTNNIYSTGYFSGSAEMDALSSFSLTSFGGYDVFIHKINDCLAPSAPINYTNISNQNICIGSSTTFSVTSSGNVSWFATPSGTNSLGTGTLFLTPMLAAGTYTYYAEANTCTVSALRTAITVTVDPTCQDVWPGDANSDGVADNLDVLELGLHYTQTGTPRASISNNWQSFHADNWSGTITNGKNLNHSDCNGDGTIDDNDTLAIYNNYGLTHAFKSTQTTTVNPQLSIVPDQTSVVKGVWGTASIYLGDATTSINNINGVAFTVDFDNTLIETNSMYIEYQNSFIEAGQNLHFRKLDFANSKLFTASTHTISNNVSGYGKIATLHYQIKSNLTTDQVLNIGLSQANQSNASGTITPLTAGTGTLMAMGSSVGLQELNGNIVYISPNPSNGLLTINSKTELQKIEVISVDGKVLLNEVPTSVSHTLHLDNFANGIYFVNLYQNDRVVKREKVILNK